MSSRDQMTRGLASRTQSVRGCSSGPTVDPALRSQARRAGCSVHRYYDPATDQFLSVDPAIAKTGQPYAFAGNNPLNATDPLGLAWYCMQGTTHWYNGNAYVSNGTCGFGEFGQYCYWGNTNCTSSARWATQAQATAFDEAMVELADETDTRTISETSAEDGHILGFIPVAGESFTMTTTWSWSGGQITNVNSRYTSSNTWYGGDEDMIGGPGNVMSRGSNEVTTTSWQQYGVQDLNGGTSGHFLCISQTLMVGGHYSQSQWTVYSSSYSLNFSSSGAICGS